MKSIKECHHLHHLTLFSSMKDERSFMDVVVIWDVCRNGHKNNRIIKEGVISPERDDMCHCAFELSSSELKSHLLGLAAVLDLFFFSSGSNHPEDIKTLYLHLKPSGISWQLEF